MKNDMTDDIKKLIANVAYTIHAYNTYQQSKVRKSMSKIDFDCAMQELIKAYQLYVSNRLDPIIEN